MFGRARLIVADWESWSHPYGATKSDSWGKYIKQISWRAKYFWDVMPCFPVEVQQHFRGMHCLHLQVSSIRLPRAVCLLCWLLALSTLRPYRWRQYVPSKRRRTSTRPSSVTSQKICRHSCQHLKSSIRFLDSESNVYFIFRHLTVISTFECKYLFELHRSCRHCFFFMITYLED
jgi:hypothetical protein